MNGRKSVREILLAKALQKWCLIACHSFVDRSCPQWRARKNYRRLYEKYPEIAAKIGLHEFSAYG
jgi:hypothetical protein